MAHQDLFAHNAASCHRAIHELGSWDDTISVIIAAVRLARRLESTRECVRRGATAAVFRQSGRHCQKMVSQIWWEDLVFVLIDASNRSTLIPITILYGLHDWMLGLDKLYFQRGLLPQVLRRFCSAFPSLWTLFGINPHGCKRAMFMTIGPFWLGQTRSKLYTHSYFLVDAIFMDWIGKAWLGIKRPWPGKDVMYMQSTLKEKTAKMLQHTSFSTGAYEVKQLDVINVVVAAVFLTLIKKERMKICLF